MPHDAPAPKGILFDLGDTVLREMEYQPLIGIAQVLDRSGLRPDCDRESTYAASLALLSDVRAKRDSQITEFPFQSWLRLIFDQFAVDRDISLRISELEFWKVSARMEPQPGIAAVLDSLTTRGIPIGVVSNAMFSADILKWELARHRLDGAFRFVMSSADYGLQKPHLAIFRAAAARLGFQPHEIWFVGDNYDKDVMGASGAGMIPLWYNPGQESHPAACPAIQVADWAAFLELIAGW
jgi:putative hydrolase of the HAD superfamily